MDFTDMKRITFGDKRAVQLEIGGHVVWNGLPRGYTELEYIETTGEQYINTGFVPNQDTRIVCEFMYFDGTGIYGSRSTVSSRNFSLRVINGNWQLGYGAGVLTGTIKADTKNWHTADQNKNTLYIDGELAAEREYVTFNAPYPVAIGAIRAGSMYYGEGRYRAFKIYDNGVLVRRFIPCKNPDGNIGMYDTVSGQFYGNAGTGEFVAGAEWSGLPVGYKRLDYIETTGEQYIDTGFKPNQDTRVVCEFMWRGTGGSGNRDIYGSRDSISRNMYWLRVVSSKWQPAYDGTLGGTEITADATNWHIADQNKNIFYIDGVLGKEFEYADFETELALVFGGGQSPYQGYTYYPGKARYRACQIYDNDVLIRDYIPCKTKDGRIGMYDTLNAAFYGNAGTGEFIAGAEV